MRRPDLFDLPLSVRLGLVRRLLQARAMTPEAMAAHAKASTRFYAGFYRDHDPADFASLPVLRKEMVRDISPYDLLARGYEQRVRWYGETTGSTGSPTPAFYTSGEFRSARVVALCSPWLDKARRTLRDNRTCVNGLAFGFTIAGPAFGDVMAGMGGLVAQIGSRSTLATPPRIARGLARLEPAVMTAAPVDFLAWMRILREDWPERYDAVAGSLKFLISSAELCSASRSRRLCEHFGIDHIDVYACVEGMFSLPCTCGAKHILPAWKVELFDRDLAPIGPTGTGRLAFTSLVKRSTPMLRYLLDDQVTVERCACPHGFELSVVPHGRYELNCELPCGTVNVRHFEEALFEHGLFGDYQVLVHDDHIAVTVERYADPPVPVEAIEHGFREAFGLETRVTAVAYGELTDYRAPRGTKPILRLRDQRASSTQDVPKFL